MTKYKIGPYKDFKRMLADKQAIAVYLSRQIFEKAIPAKEDAAKAPDAPPGPPQHIYNGYLLMVGENADGDTMTFISILPDFPTDKSKESVEEIGKKINEIELGFTTDIETLKKPPAFYSGEIEDEHLGLIAALGQVAVALKKEA